MKNMGGLLNRRDQQEKAGTKKLKQFTIPKKSFEFRRDGALLLRARKKKTYRNEGDKQGLRFWGEMGGKHGGS